MDSPLPGRVYDPRTEAAGGTNADDLTDALRTLPVVIQKETTSPLWHREDQVVRQNPDLVVSHLSCLYDSRVGEGLKAVEDHEFSLAQSRLVLYFGYVAEANPRTRFLVYSRGAVRERFGRATLGQRIRGPAAGSPRPNLRLHRADWSRAGDLPQPRHRPAHSSARIGDSGIGYFVTLSGGFRLGPYEILSPLGAGGMGEVYKARDTRLERTVAVKVLPQHLSSSPEVRQRFEREAKTISQLSHPHICALYDVGREGETEYLVMEYLEGETLSERLAKGALPLDQTLRYGTQIADALDKAHRQGIVHRDLKPGNVMLTKSGREAARLRSRKGDGARPRRSRP